jgi:hypothetical protein
VVEIQCFGVITLLQGVDPRGVNLSEVLTSLHISAYLECCFAVLLKPSTAKCRIYLCILDSTTAFALCWEADMTYP